LALKSNNIHGQSLILSNYALRASLMTRDPILSTSEIRKSSIMFALRALALLGEIAHTGHVYEPDLIRAHWLFGAAYRLNGELHLGEPHLSKALTRCRAINLVPVEANILLDLAHLRYDQKKYEEAKSLVDEALLITERCNYVLQGADVNLFLAQYALEQEKDKVKAKTHAEEALKLATCDGPPYYYKVAYEEAERFLENLK
jgi:tetratricopeptide (TPR) repeat protein